MTTRTTSDLGGAGCATGAPALDSGSPRPFGSPLFFDPRKISMMRAAAGPGAPMTPLVSVTGRAGSSAALPPRPLKERTA